MNASHFIAVFVGGGVGSLARFSMSILFRQWELISLPYSTLMSNVLSCLVLGITVDQLSGTNISWLYYLVIIGFCGGFSTFSTFSFETLELMRNGQMVWAILNVVVSVVFCVFLLFVLTKSLK